MENHLLCMHKLMHEVQSFTGRAADELFDLGMSNLLLTRNTRKEAEDLS